MVNGMQSFVRFKEQFNRKWWVWKDRKRWSEQLELNILELDDMTRPDGPGVSKVKLKNCEVIGLDHP